MRTPDEVNALLHGHIQSLRENPFLADAKIMFIAEKNTGYESARMWDVVKAGGAMTIVSVLLVGLLVWGWWPLLGLV